MKTKTEKTPLMMAEAYSLSCWSSVLVPEHKCSHGTQAHPSLVPRLRHHEWKNHRPSDSKTDISHAQLFFSEQSERCFCL